MGWERWDLPGLPSCGRGSTPMVVSWFWTTASFCAKPTVPMRYLLSSSCTYLVHEDYHGFPRFVSNQIPSSCEIWEPATHEFGWFNPHLGGLATRILHPLCALLCVSCILLYSVLHGFAKLWHFYFYPLQTSQNWLKGRDYMEVRTWFHVFVPFNQSIQPPLQPLVSYIIISYHNMPYRYVVM